MENVYLSTCFAYREQLFTGGVDLKFRNRVTLQDVAKHAGVSIATVSRVINGSSHPVSHVLKRKVLKAIRELDYFPDGVGRNLRKRRSPFVSVVVHDITDAYFSEIVRGVEDVANANGYLVMVCNTDRISSKEISYIKTLREARVEGIILCGGGILREEHQKELSKHLESLKRQGVAVVALATQKVSVPSIRTDNVELGRIMTQYLVNHGHRRIAFICGPREIFTSHERLQGYKKALDARNIPFDPNLIVWSDFTEKGGIDSVRELCRRGVDFTAIAASNDEMAIGCIWEIKRAGLKVPDDVSVIGANNIPSSEYVDPPLTTVEVPMYLMGKKAMEVVLQIALKGEYPEVNETVPLRIVERCSVSSPLLRQ